MKIFSINIVLVAILVIAAVLRFYGLGTYPALNADEAAIGYNAFSLIETGKDEHGNPWPIHFQSFNDYKPGGYFYIALPFIYFFGLNEWSVRLPGAIFGVLTVFIVFLLAKEIGRKRRGALFEISVAGLLAISPWHIHFSRGAWEVNMATFFISLGLLFFLKSLRKPQYFALWVLSFILSLYTYHAARVVVPVLGIALAVMYRRTIFARPNIKLFAGSVLFGLVLFLPLAQDLMKQAGLARVSGVSILADRGYIDRIAERRGNHEVPNTPLNRALYNKPKELARVFGENYLEHFWGEFLFVSGDNIQRNKVPDFGQLYMFQLPLLAAAVFAMVKKKTNMAPILIWLMIAPIPAALTFQSPHALRSQSMAIPLTILSGYGLVSIFYYLREKAGRNVVSVFWVVLSVVVAWEFARYVHQYWVHTAKTYPYSSQYGVKELTQYIRENEWKYDKIFITTRYDQPYILFLFYGASVGSREFSPSHFQERHVLTPRDKYGFSTVGEYGKYIFRPIDLSNDEITDSGGLAVGADEEIPEETNIIKNIYGTNGYLYFQVVAN